LNSTLAEISEAGESVIEQIGIVSCQQKRSDY
jgi:hypothetical protein